MNKQYSDEDWSSVKNNGAFCPAPFFSYYIDTNSKLSACCVHNSGNNLASPELEPGERLKDAYNHQSFRELRHDLIHGIKNKQCNRCWTNEDINTRSMRHGMLHWMHTWPGAEEYVRGAVTNDYSIDQPLIYYIDIRFDNTCNLRCRTCLSHYSTSLYPEERDYLEQFPEKKTTMWPPVQFVNANVTVEQLKENLKTVKRIYFAGGEPLIMPQHYEILDYLIEQGRTDVDLYYNTNFSKLTHSGYDVIEYWKKFKNVTVGASLDGSWARGEYIRKNLSWNKVIENRQRMIAEVPHVRFVLSPTVSIMNVYNILEFHREWTEKNYIGAYDLSVNLLFRPDNFCIKNLPKEHKTRLETLYAEHIQWIKNSRPVPDRKNKQWFCNEFNSSLDSALCVSGFGDILKLLGQDADPQWHTMWHKNQWLDLKRSEDFYSVFPEYEDLRAVIQNHQIVQ